MTKTVLSAMFALLFFLPDSNAQLFRRKTARRSEAAPKAILVKLNTYPRLQQYLQQKGSTNTLNQLRTDAAGMNNRLVLDFDDNFTYAPVYYFVDTNMKAILDGAFENVLLDAHMQPVKESVLKQGDKNFQIVYFGNPAPSQRASGGTAGGRYDGTAVTSRRKKKLVVLNSEGDNVSAPRPDGASSLRKNKPARPVETYIYKPADYDIYYKPYAKDLDDKMRSFYGAYPY